MMERDIMDNVYKCAFHGRMSEYVQSVDGTIINPFQKDRVSVDEMVRMGSAFPEGFSESFRVRTSRLGLNGRTQSGAFTVACLNTHRRAWETMLGRKDMPYGVIMEHDVVLEEDWTVVSEKLHRFVMEMERQGIAWDVINLMPTWKFCNTATERRRIDEDFVVYKTNSSMSTSLYIVKLEAADLLLRYSVPYTMPVDYLLNFLFRMGLIQQFSLETRLGWQDRITFRKDAHDAGEEKECDPDEERLLLEHRGTHTKDERLLKSIEESKFFTGSSLPIRRLCYSMCRQDILQRGERNSAKAANEKISTLLSMLGKRRVVVWGLDNMRERHTHAFLHESFATFFSSYVSTCYVSSKAREEECREDLFEQALIIASPKHMVWTQDPSLRRLPYRRSSFYLFHETVPRHFPGEAKNIARWIVRGNDGNRPVYDAEHYVLRRRYRCQRNLFQCKYVSTKGHLTFVSPWSVSSESAPFVRRNLTVVNFVGTVWEMNAREFCQVVNGCAKEGVEVHRYGMNPLPPYLTCSDKIRDHTQKVSNEASDRLQLGGRFVLALQGGDHIDPENTYLSDRLLRYSILGAAIATNNPKASRWLGLRVLSPSEMCRHGGGSRAVLYKAYQFSHQVRFSYFLKQAILRELDFS